MTTLSSKAQVCGHFEGLALPPSKQGTCALDSKTGGLLFAWALELCESRAEEALEQARLEVDLFTTWAALTCIDREALSACLQTVASNDFLLAHIEQKYNAMSAAHNRAREELGLGIYGATCDNERL